MARNVDKEDIQRVALYIEAIKDKLPHHWHRGYFAVWADGTVRYGLTPPIQDAPHDFKLFVSAPNTTISRIY